MMSVQVPQPAVTRDGDETVTFVMNVSRAEARIIRDTVREAVDGALLRMGRL